MKVVVITGASDGIGAELARQLASSDCQLVLAARTLEKLEEVAGRCRAKGAQALSVRCDVGVEADCKALIDQAVGRFGGVDALVNNAGVSGHARFEEVTDFAWYETMMRVNHFGSVWCTRYALPYLKARRGQIVAVCSLAGKHGIPGRTAYSPSKFAQAGFFEALRIELYGTGVDVTIAYPGVVATNIRVHGYGADGRAAGRSGLDESHAMPVEECARLIAQGMARRSREVVMGARGKLGLWLKLIAPRFVDRMALRALRKS